MIRNDAAFDAVVVGGGIAGIAATTALSERGLRVALVESEPYLGGRAGGWTDTLRTGERLDMERGFHAFFRQYYGLRALLRRVDPELSMLEPLGDYPILGPSGARESFSNLPHKAPLNVIALTRRTKTLSLRDLMRVDARAALRMLAFDGDATYGAYDRISAGEYLDSLRFPPAARRMLFDVFAHSFFNPEKTMSAGELLMMFHFYFMGNREGLIFDVARRPMSQAFWSPFVRYLRERGAKLHLGTRAHSVSRQDGEYVVECGGLSVRAQNLVLAVTVPALKAIVESSPELGQGKWHEQIDSLDVTLPFAVWRLWLGGKTSADRQPFVGTTGLGIIDNISLYHLFQDESREWARRHDGSVVELHAYAVDERTGEDSVRRDLLGALHRLYPETAGLEVLDERFLWRRDCPAFERGSHALRPGVSTPYPGLFLAGDFVRISAPSALMERAAQSGFQAANHILAERGLPPEATRAISPRGMLAPLMKAAPMLRPQLERC